MDRRPRGESPRKSSYLGYHRNVSFRALAALCLAGCSFTSGKASGVAGSDGSNGSGSAIDAPASGGDANEADAKPSLDATSVQGALVVTSTLVTNGDVDLTGAAPADWAHWGYINTAGFDHKIGGAAFADATLVGTGTRKHVTGSGVTASWTDGTPDVTAVQTTTGISTDTGAGLRFVVPAGTASHTVVLYAGGQQSRGRLDAGLSDSSATAFSDNQYTSAGDYYVKYTLVFNAASASQTLTITWNCEAGSGFAFILSATYQ